MKKLLLTTAALFALAAPACAGPATPITSGCVGGFCIEGEDGDEIKMDNDVANKDVTTFFGSVHGNGKPQFTDDITITTVGAVDTGSGYANIKPIKNGTLSQITYTVDPIGVLASDPTNTADDVNNAFDGFFTRAQIAGGCSSCTAVVQTSVNGSYLLDFTVSANGKDFTTIGFDEPATGPGSTGTEITSVVLTVLTAGDSFKEVKQTDWSPCGNMMGDCGTPGINPTGTVPEPSTWAMIITGFGLMGVFGWRKRTARYAIT